MRKLRLTPRQKWILDYLAYAGKDKRGRWVRSFTEMAWRGRQLNRTLNALMRHNLIEQKTVLIPRSKWPKKRGPDRRVSYGNVYFRINRKAMREHGLEGW